MVLVEEEGEKGEGKVERNVLPHQMEGREEYKEVSWMLIIYQ